MDPHSPMESTTVHQPREGGANLLSGATMGPSFLLRPQRAVWERCRVHSRAQTNVMPHSVYAVIDVILPLSVSLCSPSHRHTRTHTDPNTHKQTNHTHTHRHTHKPPTHTHRHTHTHSPTQTRRDGPDPLRFHTSSIAWAISGPAASLVQVSCLSKWCPKGFTLYIKMGTNGWMKWHV